MKKRISTIIFVGILAVGLFMGSVAYTKENHRETEDENQQEITITKIDDSEVDGAEAYDTSKAYYSGYNDSGLETYIVTAIFNETEDYVREVREADLCEYVYENEDGMIEMKVSKQQEQVWIEAAEQNIEEILAETEGKLYSFSLDSEYTTLSTELSKNSDATAFMSDLTVLIYNAEIYQIFTGKKEWSVNLIIKNMDNGKELINVQYPQEPWNITPEMWD